MKSGQVNAPIAAAPTRTSRLREEVLELFSEASTAPRSIFAELPPDGVGIEFSKRKRKGEDPLVARCRALKYAREHRDEQRARDRKRHHSDPALQKRKADRKTALAAAKCKSCGKTLGERSHLGPKPDFCNAKCSRAVREAKATALRQKKRQYASKDLTCQHCEKRIKRVGSRGRLPKHCAECQELSRNRKLSKSVGA